MIENAKTQMKEKEDLRHQLKIAEEFRKLEQHKYKKLIMEKVKISQKLVTAKKLRGKVTEKLTVIEKQKKNLVQEVISFKKQNQQFLNILIA